MILNDTEQRIWAEQKDFFAPNGIPNDVAYDAYLGKYAQMGAGYQAHAKFEQQQLVGVLLKNAPDAAFEKGFKLYYPLFRTGANSVQFDDWLGEFAAERPAILAKTLRSMAPDLNFTQQVMVLRDIQKWFPGSNIKDYAPPKLLKTKPTVILKQFNPTLVDMPYLLAMSASLMAEKDPQSKALGDTIVRGSFIARYGMPEDSPEDRGPTWPYGDVKYSGVSAFAMLERYGIEMDPRVLLEQVQLRYNAQSVMFDALAYSVMVLETDSSTQPAKSSAQSILQEVLSFAEKTPDHPGFGLQTESAFARIYTRLEDDTQKKRIEELMAEHMRLGTEKRQEYRAATHRTYRDVLSTLASVKNGSSALHTTLVGRMYRLLPEDQKMAFLQSATVDADIKRNTVSHMTDRYDPATQNALFALLEPSGMEDFIAGSLRTFFENDAQLPDSTDGMKTMLCRLAQLDWSPEQSQAFRDSPLAATTMLLYLYLTATGQAKYAESTHRSGLPFTQWEPLPLLKKVYPDKMPLRNKMTVGLLQMPMEEQEAAAKMQYQQVMGSMFQAFSQAFLADGPSLAISQGIVDSLGVCPLDYFLDAHKKAVPAMDLDLPEDMFSFD